jgi:hypothetical protein
LREDCNVLPESACARAHDERAAAHGIEIEEGGDDGEAEADTDGDGQARGAAEPVDAEFNEVLRKGQNANGEEIVTCSP